MEKLIGIDTNYDSYKSFFDHTWAQNLDKVAGGTPFEEIVFDLCASWKAAANTHRLPWLAMQLFKSFAKGLNQSREPIAKVCIEAVAKRLPVEMQNLRNMQRQDMRRVLQRIQEDVCSRPDTAVGEFVIENLWPRLIGEFEFHSSIWATQSLCFGSLYYAYEDCLVRTYRVVVGDPAYRFFKVKQFAGDFAKAFDDRLRDFCFSGDVNVARLVRNAFAHNGGREREELRKEKHSYHVADGEIHISPTNTKDLFELLKVRATRLITEAIARLRHP
jgi:hypothetical protein